MPSLPARLRREKNEPRTAAFLRLLRRIALANRGDQVQTFYSRRNVAEHFKLPLSLVSRVFLQLEDEGLLGRIRGSRTVLHGLKYDRNLRVRGIVGLPVSLFRFSALSDYRAFILHLRRQLRHHGFMPAAVFFERQEARGDFLAERLLEARADTVIWISPDRACKGTVSALKDAGVRVVGAGDCLLSSLPCRYQIRRENALRAVLRKWRACGVTETVLLAEPRVHSAENEQSYRAVSEEQLLPSRMQMIDEGSLDRLLATFLCEENRGTLLTASAAALCMLREPGAFGELMGKRHVVFVEGTPSAPFAIIPDVRVEIITLDWKMVAETIVEDLAAKAGLSPAESLVFDAEAHLAVWLRDFCRQL